MYRKFIGQLADKVIGASSNNKKYRYWRIRIFYTLYLAVVGYYLTRKSFAFVVPQLIKEDYFTKPQLGLLISIFHITYGINKLFGGMMADSIDLRYFLSFGLLIASMANIFLGLSFSTVFLILFLFINNFFQSWIWPGAARSLTHWYDKSNRGFLWGILGSARNIGLLLTLFLAAISLKFWNNWRLVMFISGACSILITIFIFKQLRNVPESQGLLPLKNNKSAYLKRRNDQKKSSLYLFLTFVLKNKYVWLLTLSYTLIYMARTAINDWVLIYLIEHGYKLSIANTCMSFFEIGGFLGYMFSGWWSDHIFKGMRGQTNILFSIGAFFTLIIMWFVTGKHFFTHAFLILSMGFFIFGPQALIVITAAELTHVKTSGVSAGYITLFAHVAVALAEYPLGIVISKYNWNWFFTYVVICIILAILSLLPLYKVSTYKIKTST